MAGAFAVRKKEFYMYKKVYLIPQAGENKLIIFGLEHLKRALE